MKIAYIIPSLVRSGPIKVVYQLTEYLHREHDIDVFYLEDRTDRELMSFSVPVNKISFKEAIDFDMYDIVHSHTIVADWYILRHHQKLKYCKSLTTIHNYAYEDLPMSYGKLKGYLMAFLWSIGTIKHDMQIVLSHHAKIYYQKKWWPNKRFSPIYNGINQKTLPQNSTNKNKELVSIGTIASAGGINRRKGIDQIIKALTYLPENYHLYIAGKDTSESDILKVLATKMNVLERVTFLGYVSDMDSFISQMDLFVVAPRSEGFSLALQEIVRYQKSVICSNLPIFHELFSEEEVTFFELENIEDLAKAIEKGYKNRYVLAPKAYQKFLANYTSEIMAKNYLKQYKELVYGQ